MPITRLTGRNLKVKWQTGAQNESTADVISAGGTDFGLEESDDEIDYTGYGDPGMINAPAGYPRRTLRITIPIEAGDPAGLMTKLAVGTEGRIYWYREGESSGKPKEYMDAFVQSRSRPMPHNQKSVMSITFSAQSGITEDVVA